MRIGFDISQTGQVKAGCGYFADGLIRQLAVTDVSNDYVLYPALGDLFWDPECRRSTFHCDRPNFERMDVPRDFDSSRRFWRNPGPAFESRIGSPDIFHSNNYYCPWGLQRARLVYTLYDLSFLEEPNWTTEESRIGCFQGIFRASLAADWIVAISQHSRQHFLSVFPEYPQDRVSVVYPASRFNSEARIDKPAKLQNLLPGAFWLSVGTIEPRKNQSRLIDAYRLVKRECGSTFPLVMAGGYGWLMENFYSTFRELELGKDVILTGYVSDIELQWLFQNCFSFIYPSYFEGFGMPVLEALSLGSPVLCSRGSSLQEAGGSAARYFDPHDAAGIADAMKRLAFGEISRERMKVEGIRHAATFSWTTSAARVSEVYTETLQRPPLAAASAGGHAAAVGA